MAGLGRFLRDLGYLVGDGLRWRSGGALLFGFLFAALFVVGLGLVLLGFDLDAVDRWLEARAGWFDLIGTLLFRALLVLIVLVCGFAIGAGLYQRVTRAPKYEETIGWSVMILALAIGWFCWGGIVSPL